MSECSQMNPTLLTCPRLWRMAEEHLDPKRESLSQPALVLVPHHAWLPGLSMQHHGDVWCMSREAHRANQLNGVWAP